MSVKLRKEARKEQGPFCRAPSVPSDTSTLSRRIPRRIRCDLSPRYTATGIDRNCDQVSFMQSRLAPGRLLPGHQKPHLTGDGPATGSTNHYHGDLMQRNQSHGVTGVWNTECYPCQDVNPILHIKKGHFRRRRRSSWDIVSKHRRPDLQKSSPQNLDLSPY